MQILYWFLALNLLIVLTALWVKKRRRQSAPFGAAIPGSAAPASRRWTVTNDILGIGKAGDDLRDFLESRGVPIKEIFDLAAILEEMGSFVLAEGLPDRKSRELQIDARIEAAAVHLELRYEGRDRNPLEVPAVDLTKPLEEITLEGMDIHLLRYWADGLDYRHEGGRCLFTAVKNLPPSA